MITEDNNKELRNPQAYVPARIKVINVTAQGVICTSPERTSTTEQLDEETFNWQ